MMRQSWASSSTGGGGGGVLSTQFSLRMVLVVLAGFQRQRCCQLHAGKLQARLHYADFAKQFTAEFYDAARWADVFNASGAGSAV